MSWISTNNLRRFADKLFHGNLSFGGSVTHNGATTFNGGVKVNTTKAEFAAPVSFTGTTTYKGNEVVTKNEIDGVLKNPEDWYELKSPSNLINFYLMGVYGVENYGKISSFTYADIIKSNLDNFYAAKSDTYTKAEVDNKIADIRSSKYNLYVRSALPTSAKTSITINPMMLTINGSAYELKDAKTLLLNDDTAWDVKYVTASNRAGKDFYIYACQPSSGTIPTLILSANSTVPTGYTATNSRKIGGFHCECLDVGTVTDENTMNGYATGDIIPYSIWDLKHRPKSSPEGMVYVEPLNVWISIYIMSWDGSKLVSAYNGVQADGASAKPFSGTEFAEYLAKVNMRLPRYDEFVVFAKGIQECVNVKGSTDVNTTGGHYTTDNKRIISSYGIEDCAGVIWQWLSDVFGSDFAGSWNTSSNRDARNTRGDCWGGGLRRALAGGGWFFGAGCGSRASIVNVWSAGSSDSYACHCASEPLITDY